jgi:hypothetical protein
VRHALVLDGENGGLPYERQARPSPQ